MIEEDDARGNDQGVASVVGHSWFVLIAISNDDIGDVLVMVSSVCMVPRGRQ